MNDEDRKERYAELAILVEKFNAALYFYYFGLVS